MPQIIFTHPISDETLEVGTGANKIEWGYGLNTNVTPTYGGEVVQILSAYIDDLTIEGELKTYEKMEQIYSFFLAYMQTATQGGYVEEPMLMHYPTRGWKINIRPTSMPGFRYGTEVVAPAWRLQANVAEQDPAMARYTLEQAAGTNFDFTRVHAGVGYDISNPWTDPASQDSPYDPQEGLKETSDFYQNLIPSYLDGDFDSLFTGFYGSGPTNSDKKKKDDQDEEAGSSHDPTGSNPNPGPGI